MTISKLFSPVRLTLFGVLLCAATVGILAFNPQKASADQCSINGRDCYFGYFFNGYDGGPAVRRNNVLSAPALLNVVNGGGLVATIRGHMACVGGVLVNQGAQNATGSAFIVLTMLGAPPGTPKNVACQRLDEWSSLVYNYEASGLVNFNIVHDFGGINTRSSVTDVTYYPMNGSAPSIVFYSPITGQPIYAIKKDCGNPIGHLQAVTLNYDLKANIGASDSSGAAITGPVEPGEQITFYYNVHNDGATASPGGINCTARTIIHTGYFPTPAIPEGGGTNVPTNCPRDFPPRSIRTVAITTVTAAANQTVCATLVVAPANTGGGSNGKEVCVPVAAKPYLAVYGGDVAAGGGLETAPDTCTLNPNGSIVSWNKNTTGFAGAGTQYAALAMGTIKAFTTAQNSPAGGAGMPGGLSFSSTTQDTSAGYPTQKYGGDFTTAKCIKDYFAEKPAATTTFPANVTSMTTGNYYPGNGIAATLAGGNVTSGDRIRVYVDGDLYITSNITFTGSWSYANIPMFEVVVRGNIYVDRTITRLDGTYIAQPRPDNSRGYIYTCTTSAAAPSLATIAANYASVCSNKLTVNGSFVAREIQFLRNSGTLRSANPADNKTTNSAGEVFNYGPGFWITQPNISTSTSGEVDNYDAITSLPPVL